MDFAAGRQHGCCRIKGRFWGIDSAYMGGDRPASLACVSCGIGHWLMLRRFHSIDGNYGTQRAGSLGSSGSFCEDAHIANKYQLIPNNPKIALIRLSAKERLANIDQAKSAKAQRENTRRTLLLLKPPRCCFVSFISEYYAPGSNGVIRRLHS